MKRTLLVLGLLIALCIVVSPVWAEATIWTDKEDYSPWETVYISGEGFTPGATVSMTVEWPDTWIGEVLPPAIADVEGKITAAYPLTSGLMGYGLEGTYTLIATDSVTGERATTTFTDAAAQNVNFATLGLPPGTSVSVSYSGTNNGDNPISGTATFSSPGPSTTIGTKAGSSFSFGFPSSITVSGVTYDFQSASKTNPFTTSSGSPNPPDTVTATYEMATPSDTTPPVITHEITGTLGNNGWYTSDVTVTWTATDAESAITSTSGTNPITINYDTSGVTVSFSATSAGGTTTDSVTIKRDATSPTISGSASPSPNGNGWNNEDVTVTFSASDATSGLASVTDPVTLSTEGAGQFVTGTATDNAGNSASTTVSGINIDKTAPTLSLIIPTGVVLNQPDVAVIWTALDALSGIDGAASGSVTVDTTTVGEKSGMITVYDKAGNSASETWTVAIGYNILGFLQPIDMDGSSIFKLKSTVPAKFQLTDYYGNYISTAIANLKTAKISDSIVGDDVEAVSTSAATTGSLFRYDTTANQYIFNLGTKTLSTGSYQIKAVLDSGQTIQVVISLK